MKTLITIIIVLVIGIGTFFYITKSKTSSTITPSSTEEASSTVPDVASQPLSETYKNDKYHFSLRYPVGLSVSEVPQDNQVTVIVLSQAQTGNGMQIYITPFDEDLTVLTVERIKKDQPDLIIRDPQDVVIGSSGKGVAFLDNALNASAQRQIWFVAGKQLYQITAPFSSDTMLRNIMNTWSFVSP